MIELDNIIRTVILIPTLNHQEIAESCAFIEQEAEKLMAAYVGIQAARDQLSKAYTALDKAIS